MYKFTRILEQPKLLAHSCMSENTWFKRRIYLNDDGFKELMADVIDGRVTSQELMDACVFYREKLWAIPVEYNVYIEEAPILGLYLLCVKAGMAGLNVDDQLSHVLVTMNELPRRPLPAMRDIICRNVVERIREELRKLPDDHPVDDRIWRAIINLETPPKLQLDYE